MLANIITLTRLLLAFSVVALFGRYRPLDIALIFTILIIFTLDAVDGIIARKRNETSEIGALLDTIADRIIENTFWIYFAAIGLLPLWIPITVMARGVITDNLQHRRSSEQSGWTHVIAKSRISRALYGIIKMLTFICLASTNVFNSFHVLEQAGLSFSIIAVAFCLLRALPTVIETYKTMRKKTDAKHFSSIPQSTEKLTQEPSIPKKAVR